MIRERKALYSMHTESHVSAYHSKESNSMMSFAESCIALAVQNIFLDEANVILPTDFYTQILRHLARSENLSFHHVDVSNQI